MSSEAIDADSAAQEFSIRPSCFSTLENELHKNFADTLTRDKSLLESDEVLQLDAYCANDNDRKSPLAVVGDVGCGKSALLANWARLRQSVAQNDEERVFYHAIGCSRLSSQLEHLLRRLERWLLTQFDLKDDIDLSDDDLLRWMLPRILERVSKKGIAIIILDGLQHMKERGLKWLPSQLPPNIHVIVSSSKSSEIDVSEKSTYAEQQQLKMQQIYDELERRKWQLLLMRPLSEQSVRSIVEENMCVEKHSAIVDDLCSHPNANNPAFLTHILKYTQELLNAANDDIDARAYFACRDTTDLIDRILTSRVDEQRMVYSLSLLFIARHGLLENELIELLEVMMSKNDSSVFCDIDTVTLFEDLSFVGVSRIRTKHGELFTLPVNNTSLRMVVWDKIITTTTKETQLRSLVIEYFQSKDASLRYCEEYPWQQKKNQCPELARTLVDLRVLDIMFNSEALKNELYTYLKQLVQNNNFDVVVNFNAAAQKWYKKCKPTSTQMSMMATFLGGVINWFGKKFAEHSEMPRFMRDKIQVDHLLQDDVSDQTRVLQSFATASKDGQHYFYIRWLWCNWPWIALKNVTVSAPSIKESRRKTQGEEYVTSTESPTQVKAQHLSVTLPSHLKAKLRNITSDECQTRNTTGTINMKLRDAKSVLDSLKIEKKKSMQKLQMLKADQQLASLALADRRQRQVEGDLVIADLTSRYSKIRDLFSSAVGIEKSFNEILAALEMYDPAKSCLHDLECIIGSKEQEIANLKSERALSLERIRQIQKEEKNVKSLIKSTSDKAEHMEPMLLTLRSKWDEVEERKKSELVKKFDSAAFGKRVQLVGKIAKRRQDKLQHNVLASQQDVEVLVDHPMIKVMEASGKKDVVEIVNLLERDENEAEKSLKRQESVELQLKRQQSRLEELQRQIQELDLESCCSSADGTGDDNQVVNSHDLQNRMNQFTAISKLTSSVNLALHHLYQKAKVIINEQSVSVCFMNKDDPRLHQAKVFASLVHDLCKKFDLPSSTLQLQVSPVKKYNNVRVLNKAEAESRSVHHGREI